MDDSRSFVIPDDEDGLRVDLALVRRCPGVGRAAAKALVEAGKVRLDGRRVRKGDRVRAGSTLELAESPHDPRFAAIPDASCPLTVVYEDEALVVVDKPGGVPSHPLRASERGTVAQALLARYPELAGVGFSPREPGLVHRLDIGTSGLLVAARTAADFEALRASLAAGRWDKRYLALVAGRPDAKLVVDAAIANHPGDPQKVVVVGDPLEGGRLAARSARTDVTVVERLGEATLVEVQAKNARRHQVRAHLAFVGHPLVGDTLYGGPADASLGRHFLHASRIVLPHPRDGRELRLEAPLPADLQAALAARR